MKLTETQEKYLFTIENLYEKKNNFTVRDVAKILNKSTATVWYDFQKLCKHGKLEKMKNGRYILRSVTTMSENFEKFKERYLKRFRKYYRECTNNAQRKELKKNITDNNNLSATEKKIFWEEVTKKDVQ